MASPTTAFNVARRVTAGRSWEPFRSGTEFNDAAAIAKLTGAILQGGRRRALLEAAKSDLEQQRHYRDLQSQILERRLAQPEPVPESRVEMDVPTTGALAPGETGPQVEHPSIHGSLTFGQALTHQQAQQSAEALAAERAADNARADERLALARQAASDLRRYREKRGAAGPQAGPIAQRELSAIDADQKREEGVLEDQIRTSVYQAIADLKPGGRGPRLYGTINAWSERLSPEKFTGLMWDPGRRSLVRDVNGQRVPVTQADEERIVDTITKRKMARHRLKLEGKYGPLRERHRGTLRREADEVAGDDATSRFLEAITQGP